MESKLEEKRRFLREDEEATLPFIVEFHDGRRGEAMTPLYLMDLIIHPNYSDIDDIETMFYLCVQILKDISSSFFAAQGIRTTVYDAVGPVFDNTISRHKDEIDEEVEFINADNPIILDGWDPWTVVASLASTGYLKILEKYPVWSDPHKIIGCNSCIFNQEEDGVSYCAVWQAFGPEIFDTWDKTCFFVTNGETYNSYHEVNPAKIIDGKYKQHWVPIANRKKEYIGYRLSEVN